MPRCQRCGFDNPAGMKFCGQCATPLAPTCPQCQFVNPAGFRYCGQCGTALDAVPAPAVTESERVERRQLTVLFCDLVGSSTLSETTDPEELRELIGAYREACARAMARHQGHIAQYLGDGILAYFGYPLAQEDAAVRGVAAARDTLHELADLNRRLAAGDGPELAVRIGLHTGMVVVGEIGSDQRDSLALGTTPNIAARLQELAAPNSVVISASTKRLVEQRFALSSLGERTLKGFSRPLEAYCVGEAYERPRQHSDRELPLIGREQECGLLLDRLAQAREGQGQMVLLAGEAGIGKTRLTQFLRRQLRGQETLLFECWGAENHRNSFLYAVIGVFRRLLQLDRLPRPEARLQRLEERLAAYGVPLASGVPLLSELLGLALPPGRYPEPALSRPQRKRQLLETLLGMLEGSALERPVVVVVEDLHWVDPTTIELLGLLLERIPHQRIFALLSYRHHEFTPPWSPCPQLTQISINRLTRRQSGRMIRALANGKRLPVAVFNEILGKTDGTPIFVEELTRMVLESELLRETHEHYELVRPLSSLSIPSTLHDSLMARLDRLGERKELAQLSATLGREFSHPLLLAVAETPAPDTERGLGELVRSELLFRRGDPPGASYTFRHALMHDVAYQSLLRRTRQCYHQRVVQALREQLPRVLTENPEIMAHHCSEAGLAEEAIQHWLLAGRKAIEHSALTDAVAHLQHGLAVLPRIEEPARRPLWELRLQSTLGLAYMLGKGYAAPEVQACYQRAYQLSPQVGDHDQTFPVLCGLWEYHLVRANLGMADQLAGELMSCAQATGRRGCLLEARRASGVANLYRGRLKEARAALRDRLALPPDETEVVAVGTGQDPAVATLGNTAWVNWLLGRPRRALARMREAHALAQDLNHPFTLAYAEYFITVLYQLRGDLRPALAHARRTVSLSQQHEFLYWQVAGQMLLSWLAHRQRPDPGHLAEFERAFAAEQAIGGRLGSTYRLSLLADMHLALDQPKAAAAVLERALASTEDTQECFFIPELLRLQAAIDARLQGPGAAVQRLQQAIAVADTQGNLALALRAARDLLTAQTAAGADPEAAASQLRGILEAYSDGEDCPEWRQAQDLLQRQGTRFRRG